MAPDISNQIKSKKFGSQNPWNKKYTTKIISGVVINVQQNQYGVAEHEHEKNKYERKIIFH
jgi:hypothetical protein